MSTTRRNGSTSARRQSAGTAAPRRRGPPSVNLALQGGGSHGAFTWGVLDRLLEDGRLSFEGVSGASAGAINAAVLAHGWAQGERDGAREALERFWGAVGSNGSTFGTALLGPWADWLARTFSPYQFNPVNLNPLRTILEQHVDFERLRQASPMQLFVAATRVRTGQIRVFRAKEISADVLLASACLPTVFQAVEIEGEAYWDGGFVADPPLFPFFYECRTCDLLLVMVNPLERSKLPRRPGAIQDRLHEITSNAALVAEMRAISFVQKLLREDWLEQGRRSQLKDVLMHVIRADDALPDLGAGSKSNTTTSFLRELRRRGREAADVWLDTHFACVGRCDSVDVRATFLAHE